MGSWMSTNYIANINVHLTDFENKPKQIKGNFINEWFNAGENLFREFYQLGSSLKWNSLEVKKQAEVSNIISQISKNQDWLQRFITFYPGLRIDLEGATPAVEVCEVRSGIEFLLLGFTGISKDFDKVLENLKHLGELKEFDAHLLVWTRSHRPDFFPGDQHADTPKSHWWWF